eukprot:SAG31_NODE_824_length_11760_cov_17.390790_2_plen_97_part_00
MSYPITYPTDYWTGNENTESRHKSAESSSSVDLDEHDSRKLVHASAGGGEICVYYMDNDGVEQQVAANDVTQLAERGDIADETPVWYGSTKIMDAL